LKVKLIILFTLKGMYVYLVYSVTMMVRKSGGCMKLASNLCPLYSPLQSIFVLLSLRCLD